MGNPLQTDATALQAHAAAIIDRDIDTLLRETGGDAPMLHRMAAYHLGLCDASGTPTTPEERQRLQGKRMRPLLALLTCAAAGGAPEDAGPLAAAIELLHNFTLVHDDIQDRSPTRRHRPTVWRVWGDAQAINAGDALFAAAQIGVLADPGSRLSPTVRLEVARAFNRATIDIVRGQVLDLDFEGRADVSPDAYLRMIQGKTSAIVEFAAWAGAMLGSDDADIARQFATFGRALGLGFQVQDDALGVWGTVEATGKATADDIRRRKQSLPIILLRAAAADRDRAILDRIFGGDAVDEADVERVLEMMDRYGIAEDVRGRVRAYHDDAVATLDALAPVTDPVALAALRALTDRMADRSG